jgi:hypothetical protein
MTQLIPLNDYLEKTLRKSRSTWRTMKKAGCVPETIKIGKMEYVTPEAHEAWLRKLKEEVAA